MVLEIGKFILLMMFLWGIVATIGGVYDSILDWWDKYKSKKK